MLPRPLREMLLLPAAAVEYLRPSFRFVAMAAHQFRLPAVSARTTVCGQFDDSFRTRRPCGLSLAATASAVTSGTRRHPTQVPLGPAAI